MRPLSAEPGNDPSRRRARVLATVRAIPAGQVLSYGAVAQRAGLPGAARLVARVLADNDDPALPWHRVLRADGRIAFAPDSPSWCEQRDRLLAEGVAVRSGRVRMARTDDLDALLWRVR
jgi:methylated-DNA-protein-cysteine methyltransferase related protein